MNQNQIGRTVFDIDEETDAIYLQKAIAYHEWLLQQEAQPRLTRTPIFRDREDAERCPRVDYFDDHCKYPLYYFRRRFRMNRKLFLRIVNDILSYTANPLPQHFYFFTSRLDYTGRMSISALMKCRAAIRQFAYSSTADAFYEYLQMNVVNIQQKHNNVHGFPRMLESIDCMHWEWKNCPVSWQCQYGRGDKKYPTIMLEAVASQDLWIWHAFYGIACANNNINVLDNSPLFDDLLNDLAPAVPYVVNGVEYRNGYYLAGEIYSEWASFVKSFTVATDPKHTYFKQRQESARKDVERAFAVVTSRYLTTNNQLRNSSKLRQQATINDGRVTLQPVQGRQIYFATGKSRTYTPAASGSNSGKQRTVICYNYKGEGHMSKQCTKPKRKQDDSWFKDKV
nr:hypothetical protein [Tanacetum cinerariifolium]